MKLSIGFTWARHYAKHAVTCLTSFPTVLFLTHSSQPHLASWLLHPGTCTSQRIWITTCPQCNVGRQLHLLSYSFCRSGIEYSCSHPAQVGNNPPVSSPGGCWQDSLPYWEPPQVPGTVGFIQVREQEEPERDAKMEVTLFYNLMSEGKPITFAVFHSLGHITRSSCSGEGLLQGVNTGRQDDWEPSLKDCLLPPPGLAVAPVWKPLSQISAWLLPASLPQRSFPL